MTTNGIFKTTALCASLALSSVGTACATTLNFDEISGLVPAVGVTHTINVGPWVYEISPGVDQDQCGLGSPCASVFGSNLLSLYRADGLAFDVVSFWYKLIGVDGGLAITNETTGETRTYTVADNAGHNSVDLLGPHSDFLSDITSVRFAFSGRDGDSFHIDDVQLNGPEDPSPVPLPATAGLMALALGGLGLAGGRKRA